METKMPEGHQKLIAQGLDASSCPVLAISRKANAREENNGSTIENSVSNSGCPFLNSNGGNPPLEQLEETYCLEYSSPFGFILNSIDTNGKYNRQAFDKYPIHLKHTLFHTDDKIIEIRKHDLPSMICVSEEYRDKGNSKFAKREYEKALRYYEKALACVRWLEYTKPLNMGKVEKLGEDFALLVANFDDENVLLFEDDDGLSQPEKDIKISVLVQLYLNICVCFMKLSHYKEAVAAANDGIALTNLSSQLYFRRAQALAYNKESTLEELKKAQQDIQKAIKVRPQEKIWNSDPKILMMMNIKNAEQEYLSLADFIEKRMEQRKAVERNYIRKIIAKTKDIFFVEDTLRSDQYKEMREENKTKRDKKKVSHEFEVTQEVLNRYKKIIEFHLECGNKEQVQKARDELLEVRKAYTHMSFIKSLDFSQPQSNELIQEVVKDLRVKFELNDKLVLAIIEEQKESLIYELFLETSFNKQVLHQAFHEILKRDHHDDTPEERKEKEEKTSKEEVKSTVDTVKQLVKQNVTMSIYLLLIFLGLVYLFGRRNGMIPSLFFFGSSQK
eukprot:TRINITY_DN3671_c0_g1_i1.p1 TRINITY_DN3671_c0_g1~~TRINITY_DN3671_c0_g1_i1.p1  ORF type:complete len:559 (+),score=120.23 TRINITY_DN3671_c0_g1_i1:998-2674(+)